MGRREAQARETEVWDDAIVYGTVLHGDTLDFLTFLEIH